MADFGWAYVRCSGSDDGGAFGPTGSVQFMSGAGNTSGTLNFMYHTAAYGSYSANTLILTGTLVVNGIVSASHYHIENVTEIDVSGSTSFGNTNDDVHMRTGSLVVSQVNSTTPILKADNTSQTVTVRAFKGMYTGINAAKATASIPSYILGVTLNNNVEINIPAAATYGAGAVLIVKDEVAGRGGTNIRLTCSSGYNIDNSSFYILTGSNPAISLYSNGSNWFVF